LIWGFLRIVFRERREVDLPEAASLFPVDDVVLESQPISTTRAPHQIHERNESFCINPTGYLEKGFQGSTVDNLIPFRGSGTGVEGKKVLV
jgi:hypothetical protein